MSTNDTRKTNGRGQLFESVVETIGNTPSIRINHLAPDHVSLYVKAEFFNPAASVKDRLVISIIEEAERRGDLKPSQTVVEGIAEDMKEEETALSLSTPGFHMPPARLRTHISLT